MRPAQNAARATQLVLWVTWLFLGGRFLLRAFNADITNRFVAWVYAITLPVVHPFFNWFPPVRVGDGFIVELQTLFALVAYTFLAFVALAVIGSYGRKADAAVPKRLLNVAIRRRD